MSLSILRSPTQFPDMLQFFWGVPSVIIYTLDEDN